MKHYQETQMYILIKISDFASSDGIPFIIRKPTPSHLPIYRPKIAPKTKHYITHGITGTDNTYITVRRDYVWSLLSMLVTDTPKTTANTKMTVTVTNLPVPGFFLERRWPSSGLQRRVVW
jgi:hypothetical protein